jgi:hypothetical protein
MNVQFFAVRADYLSELPTAVQAFIKDYFKKRNRKDGKETIFGIECYTAACSDDWGTEVDFSSKGDTLLKNGSSCSGHYAETTAYTDGLALEKYPFGAASWLLTEAGDNQLPGIYSENIYVFDN